MADCTITAIARHDRTVFVGSLQGDLTIYSFSSGFGIKKLQTKFDHQGKVNDISVSSSQNLFCTSGEDSSVFLYNLFSCKLRLIQIGFFGASTIPSQVGGSAGLGSAAVRYSV